MSNQTATERLTVITARANSTTAERVEILRGNRGAALLFIRGVRLYNFPALASVEGQSIFAKLKNLHAAGW